MTISIAGHSYYYRVNCGSVFHRKAAITLLTGMAQSILKSSHMFGKNVVSACCPIWLLLSMNHKVISIWSVYHGSARKVSKYLVISGPYFPTFGLNTGKYGPEITPYLGTFHAVWKCADRDIAWFHLAFTDWLALFVSFFSKSSGVSASLQCAPFSIVTRNRITSPFLVTMVSDSRF